MTTPPLAARMRPTTLDEVAGHTAWIGPGAPLRRDVQAGRIRSMLLWGPPGCGKTTLARVLAAEVGARWVSLSAVLDGVKQLRDVLATAGDATPRLATPAQPPVLFLDEIHRWNKAQQDALLPHVEAGSIVLIGATTENPSFEINAALRSRLLLVTLEPLDAADIARLLDRALRSPQGLDRADLEVVPGVLERLATWAAGDARRALGELERAVELLPAGSALTEEALADALNRSDLRHDRAGDDHHDVTSALIKSMRGSDPDAALYWLARMIAGGEDPVYIARRLVVFAAEDVGNADPRALSVAVAAAEGAHLVGLPEARILLAQAVTFLASAPKSNAAYVGIDEALAEVRRSGALPVPPALRQSAGNPGYVYPHDAPLRVVRQQHLPTLLEGRRFYRPAAHGEEKVIGERLAWWRRKLDERG